MPSPLTATLPLILAAVFVAGAVAKLRHPDDPADWAGLGIAPQLRRPWIVRLHPWAELVLGVAIAGLGGILGVLAALAAFAVLVVYTVIVVRALRRSSDASCACFGSRTPITRATVVRNVWLALLAAATVTAIGAGPVFGGALAAAAASWPSVLAAALAAVTTALILWPGAGAPSAAPPSDDGELGDYVRTRTPAVPVALADGTPVTLRSLTEKRPALLLAVSQTCGYCESIVAQLPKWRRLLPEVDVRLLLESEPGPGGWADTAEPQTVHDPAGLVRQSLGEWATPSAVLLGADGELAGGPVTGTRAVPDFIADIDDSLHGQRPLEASVDANGSVADDPRP